MPDGILPDDDDTNTPPPAQRPDPGPRSILCDMCGCTLARDGSVMRMGDRAKKLVRVEDRFDRLESELAAANEKLNKALERCHELELEIQKPDRGGVGEF